MAISVPFGAEVGIWPVTDLDRRFMNAVVSGFCTVCFIVGTAVCNTRCMYTFPGEDVFAASDWVSDDVPLGPLSVTSLSLDFYDDAKVQVELVSVIAPDEVDVLILEGDYSHNDGTAIFDSISVTVDGLEVTFIEADWGNEVVLFLLWRVGDILHPFTTPLHRVD